MSKADKLMVSGQGWRAQLITITFRAPARENIIGHNLIGITLLLSGQIQTIGLECRCKQVDDIIRTLLMSRDLEQKKMSFSQVTYSLIHNL